MKKDSPIAPKNPRSAQKAEETEISSPEVEILDAPPSRKRAAPAGGGTRGGAAKARSRSTEGKATQGQVEFIWRQEVSASPNYSFRRVEVKVFLPDAPDHAVAKLVSYVARQQ